MPLAVAELGVASALVGIVIAGLAILVAFLSEDYLEVMATAPGGVEADFFPFWFTAAIGVGTIVVNGIAIAVGHSISEISQRALLAGGAWLFLWTLFAMLNLVAFIAAHGSNRALQIMKGRGEGSGERESGR